MTQPEPPSRAMWRSAAQLSYVGIFFGVAVLIGFAFGRWAERRWGGAPWVSLAGVLVGIASGFRELLRIARRYQRAAFADARRHAARFASREGSRDTASPSGRKEGQGAGRE